MATLRTGFVDDKALRRLKGKSIQETHVDHAADNTITFEVVFTDGTTLRLRATFAQQLVVELLDHNPRLSSFARINKRYADAFVADAEKKRVKRRKRAKVQRNDRGRVRSR